MKQVFIALLLLPFFCFCSNVRNEEGAWEPLLDNHLSQWRVYQSYALPEDYKGDVPEDSAGNPLPPIGYDKNVGDVFSVWEEDGLPVLRITGETYGCLVSKEDYKNYRLRMKVKFGAKSSGPRKGKPLDSGVLYHSQGEHGVDDWQSWMRSHEFQVLQGGSYDGISGDYWNIGPVSMDIRVAEEKKEGEHVYDLVGMLTTFGADGVAWMCRSTNEAYPEKEWTNLELICFEDKALHIVDGAVVMALENSQCWEGPEKIPLVEGKIQLQSEGGEVFYKEIEIKKIDGIPESYKKYFD